MSSENLKVYSVRTEKLGRFSGQACQSSFSHDLGGCTTCHIISANPFSWVSWGGMVERIMFPPLKSEPKSFSTN